MKFIEFIKGRFGLACLVVLAIAVGSATVAACTSGAGNSTSGQQQEQQSSNDSQTIAEQVLPAPVFKYSEGRNVLTLAEASIALGEQTTSFIWSNNAGPSTTIPPGFSCPSEGYPVSNTAQLTNPDKPLQVTGGQYGNSAVTVGNMDPIQYYPPTSSQGTYVECVDHAGQPYLVYSEPNVITVSGAATWVQGKGIVLQGAPSLPVCKVTAPGTTSATTTCTK